MGPAKVSVPEVLTAHYLRLVMTRQDDVTVGILSLECKLARGVVWPDKADP